MSSWPILAASASTTARGGCLGKSSLIFWRSISGRGRRVRQSCEVHELGSKRTYKPMPASAHATAGHTSQCTSQSYSTSHCGMKMMMKFGAHPSEYRKQALQSPTQSKFVMCLDFPSSPTSASCGDIARACGSCYGSTCRATTSCAKPLPLSRASLQCILVALPVGPGNSDHTIALHDI